MWILGKELQQFASQSSLEASLSNLSFPMDKLGAMSVAGALQPSWKSQLKQWLLACSQWLDSFGGPLSPEINISILSGCLCTSSLGEGGLFPYFLKEHTLVILKRIRIIGLDHV